MDRIGEGPLLVMLHGIGGNRTNWRDQLPVFAERFTTLAWDARGYGLSDDYPATWTSGTSPVTWSVFSITTARRGAPARAVDGRADHPGLL